MGGFLGGGAGTHVHRKMNRTLKLYGKILQTGFGNFLLNGDY